MLHSMDLNRWDKQGAVAWLINLKNNPYIGYGQEKTKKVEKNQNRANTKTNSNSANLNPQSRKTNNAQVAWEKWWRTVIMKNTLKKNTILHTCGAPLRSSLNSRKSSPDWSPFSSWFSSNSSRKSPLKSTFSFPAGDAPPLTERTPSAYPPTGVAFPFVHQLH